MPAARLIPVGAEGTSEPLVLGDQTSIGRASSNTLSVLERSVSKEHARIVRKPGTDTFVLSDLGSRNGTYCNDRRIDLPVTLQHGDELRIGSARWRFAQLDDESVEIDESASDDAEAAPPIFATIRVDRASEFLPESGVFDEKTLRADYEKLRLAYTLSADLHAARDVREQLRKLLARIFEWLPVDRGVVLLVDERVAGDTADKLRQALVQVRPGARQAPGAEAIRVPKSILRHVVSRREGVLSSDARMDTRFGKAQSVLVQGIRSSMTLPLQTEERTLGVLHVDSTSGAGLFTEKDLAVLAAVSRQASIGIDNALLQRRVVEEATLRSSLSRMVSPNLVDRIVSGDLAIEKGGTLKRCTVMFADVRGFTSLTERLSPTETVARMNEYFERVTEVILQNQGTLDKYIGDAVMALWGAPLQTSGDELNAVRTAVQMQAAVEELNRERASSGWEPLRIGIGIATSDVVAGYMGSSQTLSYTVLGRGVNLAARLCGHAKGGEILLSPTTHHAVARQVEAKPLEPVLMKGMATPVVPFRLARLR